MPPRSRKRRPFGRVQRLPSGRYRGRYTGPDGGLHNAPRTFETEMDADAWLVSERRLIDLDAWTPPADREAKKRADGITVTELCTRTIERRNLRPGSREQYKSLVAKRITPYIGDLPAPLTTPDDIAGWGRSMLGDFPDTAARNAEAYRFLAGVFKDAVRDGLVESTPCVSPELGKKPRPARKPVLEVSEYEAIVKALPKHYQLYAEIAGNCALRPGEAAGLQVGDVRFIEAEKGTRATIRVARTVTQVKGYGLATGPTKTESGDRTVAVPSDLVPRLVAQVAERARFGVDAPLFVNKDGRRIRPQSFRSTFGTAAGKAGRPDVAPHQLRHFGGTVAARAGATVREIMDLMGHSTADQAIGYQHTAADRPGQIADGVGKLLGSVGE